MKPFIYQGLPSRVIFAPGAVARLAEEVAQLGAEKALVLCTPEQRPLAERMAQHLGSRAVGVYDKAVMHVPAETAAAARDEAAHLGADCCVAVGGGSTVGLGKAIALTSGLPIIAVPTTYAGSEMTPIFGLTEGRVKRTGKDPRVLPRTVIYDPALTVTLPAGLSAASGMNAIAHAVEALYAQDANPIVSLMAEESIAALARALPVIVDRPDDLEARSDALYGAWLAGTCLGSVGMAIHHKLCHTLGGTFNLPHAEVHTAVIPYAAHFNHAAAPEALGRVARALGVEGAAAAGPALWRLAKGLGLKTSLRELGLSADQLDEAARLATQNPYYNPRPVYYPAVLKLLQAAYGGRSPDDE